jgi:cyclopropane fatty-acyl-phospholipid synthase-like methyltransferase
MSNEKLFYPKFSYDEHARTCAPDDFLGQTRRTVQGVPVSDDQLQMIVEAINSGLGMRPDDVLLELACGNGALSHFIFDSCEEYLGVDISEYLISVAKKNFEELPHYRYAVQGASEYVRQEQHPERFSKVLCYAGFQFFSADEAAEILNSLFKKFNNVQTVFIGNLPDKDRAGEFYKTRQPSAEELSDYSTAIGSWRTRSEFEQLAGDAGWKVRYSTMPAKFHASYYRYDALLTR